jgi:DNA-binding transcriptional LysR family regulator
MHSLAPLQFIDVIARAGSIRKASEALAITSTALNRRVLALEDELGFPIFERLPRGVRLSTAGELLVTHLRHQASDFERLRSQLVDLAGARSGHVAIACSQAILPFFMPEQIGQYRRNHPGVTFSVQLRDRAAAEAALVAHDADLALIFEPIRMSEVQILASVRQQIHAVMAVDHPGQPQHSAVARLRRFRHRSAVCTIWRARTYRPDSRAVFGEAECRVGNGQLRFSAPLSCARTPAFFSNSHWITRNRWRRGRRIPPR